MEYHLGNGVRMLLLLQHVYVIDEFKKVQMRARLRYTANSRQLTFNNAVN